MDHTIRTDRSRAGLKKTIAHDDNGEFTTRWEEDPADDAGRLVLHVGFGAIETHEPALNEEEVAEIFMVMMERGLTAREAYNQYPDYRQNTLIARDPGLAPNF